MKMDVPNTGSLASFEGLIPKRNELPYYRKENNGYSSMLTNNGDYNYSMLNGTGNVILELCTGENSVHAILSKLQDKYPDVPEKTLFDDIVRVLHMLTQIDAISWRDKDMRNSNPFSFTASEVISDGCTLSLVMEHEIRETVKFIRDAIAKNHNEQSAFCYIWGTNYREYENATVVRQCLYSYYKDFFTLKSNGQIIGTVIVRPAIEAFLNEATIQLMALPNSYVKPVIRSIISFYASFPFKKINLLRIQLPKDFYETNQEFVSSLELSGFSLEALQKNAYLDRDLYSYAVNLKIDS